MGSDTIRGIDEHQASQVTKLAVSTLRSLRVRGGGPPYYKVRRRVVYDLDELTAWVRARRAISTADADRQQQARDAGAGDPARRRQFGRTGKPQPLIGARWGKRAADDMWGIDTDWTRFVPRYSNNRPPAPPVNRTRECV